MSLNACEIAATRSELRVNVARTGLSLTSIGRALDLDQQYVVNALGLVEPVDSVHVWAVRDLLVLVAARHRIPLLPFSALTDTIRPLARTWFPLRRVDRSAADIALREADYEVPRGVS